jgi:hypothetical protein
VAFLFRSSQMPQKAYSLEVLCIKPSENLTVKPTFSMSLAIAGLKILYQEKKSYVEEEWARSQMHKKSKWKIRSIPRIFRGYKCRRRLLAVSSGLKIISCQGFANFGKNFKS